MTHSRIKWTDDCSIELRIVQSASAAVLRLLTINGLLMVLAVTFCGSWNGSIKRWDNKREDDGGPADNIDASRCPDKQHGFIEELQHNSNSCFADRET